MQRTNTIPAVTMAVCAVIGWSIAASGPARAELLKARLAQNLAPISGLTIVAKAKGMFEKHGLDISVTNFTSGKQCLDTVIGGVDGLQRIARGTGGDSESRLNDACAASAAIGYPLTSSQIHPADSPVHTTAP